MRPGGRRLARPARRRGRDRQDARSPRRSPAAARPWRCAAPRARRRRCPTGRCWARCAATCAQRRARWPRAARCAGISRCCCPSSGPAVAESDRATLFEALRCALATIAAGAPAVILLDDLQWSDDATLELLGALADPPARAADPRGRRLSLRRGPARASAARPAQRAAPRAARCASSRSSRSTPRAPPRWPPQVLGAPPSPRARAHAVRPHPGRAVLRRGAGRRRCSRGGRLTAGARGLELAGNGEIPVPETIRDAVLLRAAGLSDAARAAAEAASVAGPRFDLELVAALGGEPGLDGAAHQRARGRDRAGRGLVPPRAGPRRHLRGRPVAAAPRAAPAAGAGPRGARRAGRRGRLALARRARGPPGARCAAARPRRSPGAARLSRRGRGRRGARWSSGPTASARASASRCSSATRAARSSPAT